MIRRPLAWLTVAVAFSLTLVACDPDAETTTPGSTTAPTASDTGSPAPQGPDPNIPYSPRPSELVPRTTGFITETLTLPTSDDARMLVTVDSTAIEREFTDTYRATSVWVTIENPGDEPWTGVPAAYARISDEAGPCPRRRRTCTLGRGCTTRRTAISPERPRSDPASDCRA
jgi:hypothetical protein